MNSLRLESSISSWKVLQLLKIEKEAKVFDEIINIIKLLTKKQLKVRCRQNLFRELFINVT